MEPEYTARSRTESDRDDRVCRLAWCASAIPHRRRQHCHAYQDFCRLSVAFADRQRHAHQPERRRHPVRELGRGFLLQCDANWNHEKTESRVADAGLLYLGKSMDSNSGMISGDTLANSISSLPWFDLKLDRALSDYNIGRTLVVNSSWRLPSSTSSSRVLGWAANGWELGGILRVSDGPPFTPTFGTDGDPLGLKSSDPYDFPNRLTGPGCDSLVNPGNAKNYIKTECFGVPTAPTPAFYASNCDPSRGTGLQCFNLRGNAGRNILKGPGLANLDFSLFKNNLFKGISEDFNAQFRVEVFNILNHANFAPPTLANSQVFDSAGGLNANAGLLTATTTSARQIQFAIKFVW